MWRTWITNCVTGQDVRTRPINPEGAEEVDITVQWDGMPGSFIPKVFMRILDGGGHKIITDFSWTVGQNNFITERVVSPATGIIELIATETGAYFSIKTFISWQSGNNNPVGVVIENTTATAPGMTVKVKVLLDKIKQASTNSGGTNTNPVDRGGTIQISTI